MTKSTPRVLAFTCKYQKEDGASPRQWIDASVLPLVNAMQAIYRDIDIKLDVINDISVSIVFGLPVEWGIDDVKINLSPKFNSDGELSFVYQSIVKSISESYISGISVVFVEIPGESTIDKLIEQQNPLLLWDINTVQELSGMSNA